MRPNRFIRSLVFAICIVCSCSAFVACNSPSSALYKSESTVQASVDVAMSAWGDYVANNHPGVAAEEKVKRAYERYQNAAEAVVDASAAYAAASQALASSGGGEPSMAQVNAALALSSQTLSDLVAVIRSFGVKL